MTYIAIIFGMLLILDLYPGYISQKFVFRSKQDTLQDRAAIFSTTLGGFGEVTADTAARVADTIDFDTGRSTRVVVTDAALRAVYDNSASDTAVGKVILLPDLRAAVAGNDVFFCTFEGRSIISRAAAPVVVGGQTMGVVYLYEVDDELGELLRNMQTNLLRISLVVSAGVVVISVVLSRLLTRRINVLLKAIRTVREGQYGMHAEVRGTDELAEMASEFNVMSDRLQSSEEMRRRFVSDASHELKTPLASVRILVDSILSSPDMPPETIREFIDGIGDETDRLTRLTERLLNVSRLDAKKSATEPVDMAEVVERVERNLRPLAEDAAVTLETSLEADCYIEANSDDIYQIVFNLMENAVKYNRSGGRVRTALYKKEDEVRLTVADTGVGIPHEDLDRIFDRFYRVDKARSREAGGSGLGLAIVKTAVEQFGGEITVESELGKGTRFSVSFPALAWKEGAL